MTIKSVIVAGIIGIGTIVSFSTVYAQDASKMSPEEYKAEITRWKEREKSAGDELSKIDKEIESLEKQLTRVEGIIEKERKEIFGLLSASDEEFQNYMERLTDLENDAGGLADLSVEELLGSVEYLEGIALRLEDLRDNDFSAFEQNRQRLDDMTNMLSNYRTVTAEPLVLIDSNSMDEAVVEKTDERPDVGITDGRTSRIVSLERKADSYQVVRGDNLWDISAKEKIYNDPFQWLKIYSANRDQISDPDIIEIDQVFVIPREQAINEHWVRKGDNLSKIAAEIYSNPFECTRIYQANKSILESPDLLLVHTILIIPKKE